MRLLDLYCGAGGAAKGYADAGFTRILGIDDKPQPRYPYDFVQADALEFIAELPLNGFNLVHASPPCQHYSFGTSRIDSGRYPDLIEMTRDELTRRGIDYVIENVIGAPLINPITLDGIMFGLALRRKRLFETNWPLHQPARVITRKRVDKGHLSTVAGHGGNGPRDRFTWMLAMEITWMNDYEITQAVPPAYTQYIGKEYIECRA